MALRANCLNAKSSEERVVLRKAELNGNVDSENNQGGSSRTQHSNNSGINDASPCGGCDLGHRDTDDSIFGARSLIRPCKNTVPNLRESTFCG
jgi:hypothetical protein